MTAAPLIGITPHPATDPDAAGLSGLLDQIVRGVEQAGGLPVVVPLGLSAATLRAVFDRLDGLLLSGGGDVDPASYGGEDHAALSGVDAGRDAAELTLTRWAVAAGRPLFGICRGLQVLNVALGGTLYADLAERDGTGRHTFYPDLPPDLRPHAVSVEPGSLLAGIVGPELDVNSMHHQGCRQLAPGVLVVARAPDGLVEGLEVAGHPFALAVQWHPECLLGVPAMRGLFEAFVAAAAAHRAGSP